MVDNQYIDLIIDKYFKKENIFVSHQIDSYNDLIDNILPKILSQFFPISMNFKNDIISNITLSIINIKIESEEVYSESGNFILYNNQGIKNFDNFKKLKIGHEILDKLSAFEINNEFEWLIAENISKNIKKFNRLI